MFERDLPGQNKAGYSADAEISALPLESCETMNNTWGYNINDRNFKSTKHLIHTLVGAAGNNANLLLNVGPRPGGDFPEGSVTHLKEIGEWMRTYGETIQGTQVKIFLQYLIHTILLFYRIQTYTISKLLACVYILTSRQKIRNIFIIRCYSLISRSN